MRSADWAASIPSPSFNTIDIGPVSLTLYGLMIGLGIIAAALFTRPRAVERGLHPDTSIEILVWIIPAGIVGARIYHIITDWVPLSDWPKIWEGGLGIPGAVLAGVAAALLFVWHRGMTRSKLLDALIPGVPLAQAIGRWGNWWNQELYGRATDLPWGLEIDFPDGTDPATGESLTRVETFHPTFLYEFVWNLGLVALLVWVDRKQVLKPGRLIWLYAAGYAVGRLWIETLRIDKATELLGVRVNIWTMGMLLVISLVVLSRSIANQGTKQVVDLRRGDDHAEDQVADDRTSKVTRHGSDEEK